mmetsp:Transcript_17721/g.29988  ORF Transcript_17721/g.29988 Transcript_17721/m.29988 type:complete len:147 (+) Transcript_17721:511-951(+)
MLYFVNKGRDEDSLLNTQRHRSELKVQLISSTTKPNDQALSDRFDLNKSINARRESLNHSLANIDLDVEEVGDRLEGLQELLDQLRDPAVEQDAAKVIIQSFCVEKAKALRLAYQFKQIRSIRDNSKLLHYLDDQLRQLDLVALDL